MFLREHFVLKSIKTVICLQVVLEGVRGGRFEDIAVADISMTDGLCTVGKNEKIACIFN